MLNKIVTANDGAKIEAQNELENLEKVSIGDISDEDFEEFVKTHKAAVSAAKQKIYKLRVSLFDEGIPPFMLDSKVWSMNEVAKKCNTQYQ